MIRIENSLFLDVANKKHARVKVKQRDHKSRFITIMVNDNGRPLDFSNSTVKVYVQKNDGKHVLNDVNYIDSSNGVVEVVCTEQMLAVEGVTPCELVIWDRDSESITTSYRFEIEVEKTYFNQKQLVSENEFDILGSINRVEEFEINEIDWYSIEDSLFEYVLNHNLQTSYASARAYDVDGAEIFVAVETIDNRSCKIISDSAEFLKIHLQYTFA